MTVLRRITALLSLIILQAPSQALVSLVTGANGYIARQVVAELLESSSVSDKDEIICLVRPNRVACEQEYWASYSPQSHGMIRVLPYDMVDGGATLQAALDSCQNNHQHDDERCVFHLASVFGPTEDHRQTALDNVKGTEDLIQVLAHQKQASCKLILTSSMAAVRGTGQAPVNGKYYTHQDWNTVSQLGVNWGASYQWSKMESERRAKELCNQHNIPLVVLNPSFVFGPASRGDASKSYSLTLVGQWARGESAVQSRLYVDVRDVARAQVAAARRPQAVAQRYILSTETRVPSQEIAQWLKDVCRQSGLGDPDRIHHDTDFDGGVIPIGEKEVEATDRLRDELGISLRPVKETMMDMVRVLLVENARL